MADEVKQAIEEMVKISETNEMARMFLFGYKCGLDTQKANVTSGV